MIRYWTESVDRRAGEQLLRADDEPLRLRFVSPFRPFGREQIELAFPDLKDRRIRRESILVGPAERRRALLGPGPEIKGCEESEDIY